MSTFDIEHYSSGNENIHTKLFDTSHPAGKQMTTVNIFQLSLPTKMLSEVIVYSIFALYQDTENIRSV